MKCPECGEREAKATPLFTSMSYVCTNQTCGFFDYQYAVEQCAGAFQTSSWVSESLVEELDQLYSAYEDDDPDDGLDGGTP